jgi:HEAT repeat protein
MRENTKYILIYALILGFFITTHTAAQVVNNQLGRELESIFPELNGGYIDLNGNDQKDQSIEIDETVPDLKVKDSIIQVQEILDFLIDNYKFISMEKLARVKESLENTSGTITEIISLSYIADIEGIIQKKAEMGDEGIYLTPSARREALERMNSLIATMVHAYKKEGQSYEKQFIEARDELFSMIDKGYPFPDNLTSEDGEVLENSMINTVAKEQASNPDKVKTAITTLGKLESASSVPYLIGLIGEKQFKVETIKALGDIGTKQALDLLSQELEKTSSAEEKRVIIGAIGKIGGDEGRKRIVSLFPESGEESIGGDIEKAALNALLNLSQGGNTSERIFTIFERYLDHDNPELQIISVNGLSYFPGAKSGGLLASLLNSDETEEVKTAVIHSLNRIGYTRTLATFITMLRGDDTSDPLKAEVIKALGENSEGPKALQYIIAHLGSPNEKLRNAVTQTLIKLYEVDPRTVAGYVARGMRSTEDELYLTTGSEVLAEIADESTLATLSTLLQKPYPEMKKNVTWALYRIRTTANPRISEELTKLVASETEPIAVRINAVRTIGAMGYDSAQLRAWQTLVTTAKMRGEKYAMLRYYAIKSLGKLGQTPKEVVSTLNTIITREQDIALKRAAVEAVRELSITGQETESALGNSFRRSGDTDLQVLILETLGDMGSSLTNELSPSLLFSSIDTALKRRVLYALAKAGSREDFALIVDAAGERELQDFILGILESANASIMKPLVERRITTETNQEIVGVLESLQSVYESRY